MEKEEEEDEKDRKRKKEKKIGRNLSTMLRMCIAAAEIIPIHDLPRELHALHLLREKTIDRSARNTGYPSYPRSRTGIGGAITDDMPGYPEEGRELEEECSRW